MGTLYKEQHHGNLIKGATSWENYARSKSMGALCKEQDMGTLYKGQHHGNLIQGATYGNLTRGATYGNLIKGATYGNLLQGATSCEPYTRSNFI